MSLDVMAEGCLIIISGNQLLCPLSSKMSCRQIVVVTTYYLRTDDFWDILEASILKHSIDVFLSVSYPLCPRFLGKIILFLQFLQAEPHSINASGLEALVR